MAQRRAASADCAPHFECGFNAENVPLAKDKKRREKYKYDLLGFLKHYFPNTYTIDWSESQKKEVITAQQVIEHGGQYAFAAPRGDGKTSRVEGYTLYSVLYGFRKFVVIVGSDQGSACEIFESVKTELRTNELLAEDFPEVCVPAQIAEDTAQKARQIKLHGNPLKFKWGKDTLALPYIEGTDASGAVIKPRGITGRLRGMKHKRDDGKNVRPDLFLLDDPQTDESANSAAQVNQREKLILGTVKGAGAGTEPIAAFMPCTVIAENDLASRFLDRKKRPDWHGTKVPLLYSFPDEKEKMWKEYEKAWRDDQDKGLLDVPNAVKFYLDNQEALDKGAKVSNPLRIKRPAVSAIQTAMDIYISDGAETFAAEYQNQPLSIYDKAYDVSVDEICSRINGLQQHYAPENCNWITIGIDINPKTRGINWTVMGGTQRMSGYIIRYDVYPRDKALYDDKQPNGRTIEQAICEGLDHVCNEIENTKFYIGNKETIPTMVLIDVGSWFDTIFGFINTANFSFPVKGSRGRANSQWKPRNIIGRSGDNVYETNWTRGRVVINNADVWQERTQKAFQLPVGTAGGLSIYGKQPDLHKWYAQQITSLKLVQKVHGPVSTVYTWHKTPRQPDDQLDSTKIAFSALSLLGGSVVPQEKKKKKSKILRKQGRSSWR